LHFIKEMLTSDWPPTEEFHRHKPDTVEFCVVHLTLERGLDVGMLISEYNATGGAGPKTAPFSFLSEVNS
jgi:hypothetical protein